MFTLSVPATQYHSRTVASDASVSQSRGYAAFGIVWETGSAVAGVIPKVRTSTPAELAAWQLAVDLSCVPAGLKLTTQYDCDAIPWQADQSPYKRFVRAQYAGRSRPCGMYPMLRMANHLATGLRVILEEGWQKDPRAADALAYVVHSRTHKKGAVAKSVRRYFKSIQPGDPSHPWPLPGGKGAGKGGTVVVQPHPLDQVSRNP